mgnify:FL=1
MDTKEAKEILLINLLRFFVFHVEHLALRSEWKFYSVSSIILKLLADAEWHKTAEIASKLGLKGTRAREIMRELCVIDKVVDNGKTKGKM